MSVPASNVAAYKRVVDAAMREADVPAPLWSEVEVRGQRGECPTPPLDTQDDLDAWRRWLGTYLRATDLANLSGLGTVERTDYGCIVVERY